MQAPGWWLGVRIYSAPPSKTRKEGSKRECESCLVTAPGGHRFHLGEDVFVPTEAGRPVLLDHIPEPIPAGCIQVEDGRFVGQDPVGVGEHVWFNSGRFLQRRATQARSLGRTVCSRVRARQLPVALAVCWRKFVKGPRSMSRLPPACIGLLLLTFVALGAPATTPKRVLLLDPFGHDVAPFSVALSAFRTTLAHEFGDPLEFYEMSLDRARFRESEAEGPLMEFLESRIANRPMDLVATIGGPGMDFVVRHHERLFSHTPIVFVAAPPEVQLFGGELDIASASDHGTTVVAWVSLEGEGL
jgi:hypothetical protein